MTISIHALREESDSIIIKFKKHKWISIHALREESDQIAKLFLNNLYDFNPRSPRGERHFFIHIKTRFYLNFNPRSPRGERHIKHTNEWREVIKFQSTLSARRATCGYFVKDISNNISIHALREESDAGGGAMLSKVKNFNPRSPRGERHNCCLFCQV